MRLVGVGVDGVGPTGPGRSGPNVTRRNSPTLWNTAHKPRLFWDGRVSSLEEQALKPFAEPKELGRDPEDVVAEFDASNETNVIDTTIEKIEFLGSHCLVHATSPQIEGELLTASVSPNMLSEHRLAAGRRLRLRLLADRLRVF